MRVGSGNGSDCWKSNQYQPRHAECDFELFVFLELVDRSMDSERMLSTQELLRSG